MKENKKNVITIIVAVTLLLVFVIGLTYALFTFTGKGERINQISTTSVTMSYSEAQNGITLTNAMPISDAAGIVLNDSNQTFEFTVSVVTGSGVSVAWEVAAEKLTGSTLTNTDVKIYLEKKLSTDVNYTAVSSPSNFVPESTASVIGTPSGEMILDQDSTTDAVVYNYILRMWVSDTYYLTDTEKTFSVKINVYGKDNYRSASSISLNKSNTEIIIEDTETLVATVTPSGAYNGDIIWSSSNPSVATVSSSGVVTGVTEGSTTITARTKNGKSANCSVIIYSNELVVGETYTLNGTTTKLGSEIQAVCLSNNGTTAVMQSLYFSSGDWPGDGTLNPASYDTNVGNFLLSNVKLPTGSSTSNVTANGVTNQSALILQTLKNGIAEYKSALSLTRDDAWLGTSYNTNEKYCTSGDNVYQRPMGYFVIMIAPAFNLDINQIRVNSNNVIYAR